MSWKLCFAYLKYLHSFHTIFISSASFAYAETHSVTGDVIVLFAFIEGSLLRETLVGIFWRLQCLFSVQFSSYARSADRISNSRNYYKHLLWYKWVVWVLIFFLWSLEAAPSASPRHFYRHTSIYDVLIVNSITKYQLSFSDPERVPGRVAGRHINALASWNPSVTHIWVGISGTYCFIRQCCPFYEKDSYFLTQT